MGGAGHVAVKHLYLTRLDAAGPGQQGQQGGFAHAVRPDETDHAPCRDVHADIVERGDPGEQVLRGRDLGHRPGRGGVHGAEAVAGSDVGADALAGAGAASAGRFTANFSGQGALASMRTWAMPGMPVLTWLV